MVIVVESLNKLVKDLKEIVNVNDQKPTYVILNGQRIMSTLSIENGASLLLSLKVKEDLIKLYLERSE